MSPTASSMAKMSRSVSVGDGLNADPSEDPSVTSSSSQVKETPPPLVAVVPSSAALATPPHATVVPVVVASPSLGNHGNQAAAPPRSLQARVPGSSRPLPDKPSIASFTPPSALSSSPRPSPISVTPLTPPRQEEEPQRDDTGLDPPPPLHPFILSSLRWGSASSSSTLTGETFCFSFSFLFFSYSFCFFFFVFSFSFVFSPSINNINV